MTVTFSPCRMELKLDHPIEVSADSLDEAELAVKEILRSRGEESFSYLPYAIQPTDISERKSE